MQQLVKIACQLIEELNIKAVWELSSASPFPKLLTQSSCSVVKLTDRKIRWIIKEKSRDVLSTADIARLQHHRHTSSFMVTYKLPEDHKHSYSKLGH